jgi:hypothetical protein
MLKVKIPIKTVSEANKREHWTMPYKRAKKQKEIVKLYLGQAIMQQAPEIVKMRPLTIKLTRIAPRKLDGDNLQMSMKSIRDSVVSLFYPENLPGRGDEDNEEFTWLYDQKRGTAREYSVLVEILKKT